MLVEILRQWGVIESAGTERSNARGRAATVWRVPRKLVIDFLAGRVSHEEAAEEGSER